MIDTDDILDCIRQYTTPDTRATKRMIAAALHLPYANTHSNAVDRMIRDAVTELRNQGHPICADSGKAGYFYSYENLSHTIADHRSRAKKLLKTAKVLEEVMEKRRVPSRPQQLELA